MDVASSSHHTHIEEVHHHTQSCHAHVCLRANAMLHHSQASVVVVATIGGSHAGMKPVTEVGQGCTYICMFVCVCACTCACMYVCRD